MDSTANVILTTMCTSLSNGIHFKFIQQTYLLLETQLFPRFSSINPI